MPRLALIVEDEAGRAAQYVAAVERAGARAVVVADRDEALAHVRKAGSPAMVLLGHIDAKHQALGVLRAIRELLPGQNPPALLVAESRGAYKLGLRHGEELNLVVLRDPDAVSELDRAVRAALSSVDGLPAALPGSDGAESLAEAAAGAAKTAEILPVLGGAEAGVEHHADALELAERLSENPLVERLARLRVPGGESPEDLQRLVADTAEAFAAPMALVWLERAGRVRFAAHPRPPADASLRSSGGHWTALRDAFGETPLHVHDAADHVFLAGNPLVAAGRIRCAAGVPLPGPGGRSIGTLAVAASSAGAISPSILDPLLFWAHRVVSELPSSPDPLPGRRRKPAPFPPPQPAGDLTDALGVGVIVSDARGNVTFANAAVAELLGLGGRKLRGMRRTAMMSSLRASGAEEAALGEISRADDPAPRRITLPLRPAGARRILRWQTRAIRLDGQDGRLDEIVDVTSEGEEIEARDDLVRIDAVTGLANRRAGEEALAREIAVAIRAGSPLSVALFEVQVRDAGAADRAFRQVAWLLRDALRGYDLVASFAPKRLLAILPQARGPQAATLAERFRALLQRTAKSVAGATVSFGVAQFEREQGVERLLSQAAAALEAAVAKGRRLSGREDA